MSARYPERKKARAATDHAVRSGKLTRPDACEECGTPGRVEAHHEDYSEPLKVRWLCRSCHTKQHRPVAVR